MKRFLHCPYVKELAPLIGLEVSQVWVWGELRLLFESGEPEIPDATVDVTKFQFIDADGAEHQVDVAADPVSAGPVLGILRHRVTAASADDWTLRLTFENGAQLVCPPD